jgi:hypothetical protein
MLFGFRFLRQVLFGENSITLNQAAAENRRGRVHEKSQQAELEAREKRAGQDDMYGRILRPKTGEQPGFHAVR